MKKKIILSVLALVIVLIGGFLLYHSQYGDRWQCKKFLMGMKSQGPSNLVLEYVKFNQEGGEFYCRYKIKEKYGYTKEHMQEFLPVKDLAERLLEESGEIPADYKICLQIRAGSPPQSISLFNQNLNNDLGDMESGGYQLFTVDIGVPCYLSELSVLTGVRSLELETEVRIDDLSGLQNMGELQYVCQRGQSNNPMSTSFTDEEVQRIKEMYPGCTVRTVIYDFTKRKYIQSIPEPTR